MTDHIGELQSALRRIMADLALQVVEWRKQHPHTETIREMTALLAVQPDDRDMKFLARFNAQYPIGDFSITERGFALKKSNGKDYAVEEITLDDLPPHLREGGRVYWEKAQRWQTVSAERDTIRRQLRDEEQKWKDAHPLSEEIRFYNRAIEEMRQHLVVK